MPADGISLPFTISGNVGSSRPEEQLSCRDYEYHTAHPKAIFCRTSASAECRHWSGRAVRWSSGAILLKVRLCGEHGPAPASSQLREIP